MTLNDAKDSLNAAVDSLRVAFQGKPWFVSATAGEHDGREAIVVTTRNRGDTDAQVRDRWQFMDSMLPDGFWKGYLVVVENEWWREERNNDRPFLYGVLEVEVVEVLRDLSMLFRDVASRLEKLGDVVSDLVKETRPQT